MSQEHASPSILDKHLELEYQQVCDNIRQSWDYIVTIVKQFFLIQIVLISLVGLGGHSVSLSGLNIAANQQLTSSNTASIDEQKRILEEQSEIRELIKKISLIALTMSGCLISIGLYFQSSRIYANAEVFVSRAAELEKKFAHYKDGAKQTTTHHVYMLQRLQDNQFRAERLLYGMQWVGAFAWLIATVALYIKM